MNIVAFQESIPTPTPPPTEELLPRALEAVEGSLASAVDESAGFLIDIGAALVSLVWIALFILVAFWIGRKVRRWLTKRATVRWHDRPNRVALLDQVLQVAFVSIAVIFGLRVLGISSSSVVTSIGIIVGALSIALQDVLKNLVAGMYLLVEQPFQRGDRISIPGANGGQDGWVENVTMRVTELRNPHRELLLIPNYILFSQVVVNRTDEEPYALSLRLLMLDVPAAQAEHEIAEAVLSVVGTGYTLPAIHLMGAGPFGAAADVRIWFKPDQAVRRAVIVAVHERFPEAVLEVVSG